MRNADTTNQGPNSPPDLYSLRGITIASAVGSCFAGGFLLSRNFTRLGRPDDARKAVLFGSMGCIVVVGLALGIEIPKRLESLSRLVFEALQVGATYVYANWALGPAFREHELQGGKYLSNWRASAIALPLVIVPFGLAFLCLAIFPQAPGAMPDDEFLLSIADHTAPEMRDRGAVDWDRMRKELAEFSWVDELREANRLQTYNPCVSVHNPRIDRRLSAEMVGTPERFAFYCFWGVNEDQEGFRILGCSNVDDVARLYASFFNRNTPELDSLFMRVGISNSEYQKLASERLPNVQ